MTQFKIVKSPTIICLQSFKYRTMMGATSEAGTAGSSGAREFTLVFSGNCVAKLFCVVFCLSVCLLNLQLLIAPLVS